jgi:hypothetical protein
MSHILRWSVIAAASAVGAVQAEEFRSGPKVGAATGSAFHVKGVVGPDAGESFCQVCKNGPRPTAILFVSTLDGGVPDLVKAVDARAADLHAKGFRAFVCAYGEVDADELRKLGDAVKPRMPLNLAVEKGGPARYELNPDAAVTVIVFNAARKVVANFAFADAKDVTREKAAAVVAALDKGL